MKRILIISALLLSVVLSVTADRRRLLLSRNTAAAAAGYTASSIDFSGVNQNVTFSGSAVTMSGAGKVITISCWINPDVSGTTMDIVWGRSGASGPLWRLRRQSDNSIQILIQDSTPTTQVNISSSANVAEAGDGWVHVYFTCNTATGVDDWDLWINGANDAGASETAFTTDAVLALDRTHLYIGTDDSNGQDTDGQVGPLWVDDSHNAANSTNVGKFYNAGNPVDLGSDGSTPFGTAPDLYMKWDSGSLGVNSGADGGTGTLNGPPTSGPTFP